MKRWGIFCAVIIGLVVVLGVPAQAQTGSGYDLTWHVIASGGGTSAGGGYTLTSTIGQPIAGVAQRGGSYTLAGGFWDTPVSTTIIIQGLYYFLPGIFKSP